MRHADAAERCHPRLRIPSQPRAYGLPHPALQPLQEGADATSPGTVIGSPRHSLSALDLSPDLSPKYMVTVGTRWDLLGRTGWSATNESQQSPIVTSTIRIRIPFGQDHDDAFG